MDEAKNHIEKGDFSENLKTVQDPKKKDKNLERVFSRKIP
jgi:hypothetical protein